MLTIKDVDGTDTADVCLVSQSNYSTMHLKVAKCYKCTSYSVDVKIKS